MTRYESVLQDPCGDLISRQAVLDTLEKESHKWGNDYRDWVDAIEEIKKSPSVNTQEPTDTWSIKDIVDTFKKHGLIVEQEPKTGHWIEVIDEVNEYGSKTYHHECSECGSNKSGWGEYKYCPNCGCRMFEPQERSKE